MSAPEPIPCGAWPSPITAQRAARASVRLSEARAVGESTTWRELRPEEQGRYVVVLAEPGGSPVDLTPPGWSVRTRVHEYGGGAYAVSGSTVYAVNDDDQRIYRQDRGGDPVAITPEPVTPRGIRYADLDPSPGGDRIVCVRELHEGDGTPVNELVVVDGWTARAETWSSHRGPGLRTRSLGGPPTAPVVAFIAWDLPQMPWDGSELLVADVDFGRIDERAGWRADHESRSSSPRGMGGMAGCTSPRTGPTGGTCTAGGARR